MASDFGENIYKKYGQPTLDLQFSGPENKRSLRNRVDGGAISVEFTRTQDTQSTYVGSDGLIKTAATDEARFDHDLTTGESLGLLIEESRTNYETDSVGRNKIAPPNKLVGIGQGFGQFIVPSAQTNYNLWSRGGLDQYGAIWNVTFYLWNKAENDVVSFELLATQFAGSDFASTTVDGITLSSTGDLTGNCTVSIEPLGNNLYKCNAKAKNGEAGATPQIYLKATGTFTGGERILVSHIQAEQGDFPTSYIPITPTFTSRASTATYYDQNGIVSIAATDVARDDAYLPDENGNFINVGLLLEQEATNIITQSDDVSTWGQNDVLLTSVSISNPFNYSTVYRIQGTQITLNREHSITPNLSPIIPANTPHTTSVYVKGQGSSSDGGKIQLRINGVGFDAGVVNYDLYTNQINKPEGSSGTGTDGDTWTIDDQGMEFVGDGWYRVWMTHQTDNTSSVNFLLINNLSAKDDSDLSRKYWYQASGDSGIYVAGAQIEDGYQRTSFIPTTGIATTRAADISSSGISTRGADTAIITGAGFSSFYNQNEGTTYSEYNDIPSGGGMWYFGPGGSPRWWSRYEITNGIRTQPYDGSGGSGAVDITIPGVTGNATVPTLKHCVAIDNVAQEHSGSANGSAVVTGSWDDITGVSALTLGRRDDLGANNGYLNAHIKRLTYWPTRLPDSDLQRLTE